MDEQPPFTQYFPPVLDFCVFVKTWFGLSSWSPVMQNFQYVSDTCLHTCTILMLSIIIMLRSQGKAVLQISYTIFSALQQK